MAEDIFDAIIVGGGVAGATAALVLARAGCDVLVVERGNFAGSKNMTGGRLYAHSLESIIPGFAEEAPVERLVVREKITMMTADSGVTLDYQHPGGAPSAASWTVLRSSFDQWLMGKA
ncbi:TPA: FAD-dependent oxidoreductase, partial [Escherichia albertii]|nr:FAD-dependent oxidoreductase [Escherichia albertii]HEB1597184.1 FAD-dependent oxidoreductase [Escherichia albertii]